MTGGRCRDIFLVCNSVDELGGVTSWTHRTARLLTERGHRVHVVGITGARVPQELGDLLYPTTTLHAVHPPRPSATGRLRAAADPLTRRRRRVRDAGMRERADRLSLLFRAARPGAVVIVAQVWAMEWVALADTAGATVIGMSHESYRACRDSSRFARVKRFYRDVDRMLVLTREDADLWIRQGMDNVGFLPNPVPFFPEESSPRVERVVVSIGRLEDEKGIDMLLDAWSRAVPRHPGWTLRIHGSGEDEEMLRWRCTSLGLDDSVVWAGRTADVPGALRAASVFALSSRAEGFPLALMEAMSAGLPSAVFDCAPGVRAIIRDGEDGILVPPGSIGALARALDRLMSDEGLRGRMGEAARARVRCYGTDEIMSRWEGLFAFLER